MNITQSSVLLRLSFSRAGNDRKASLESVVTEADKKRLKMTKKLFTCKEYTDIQSFDNGLSNWVDTRAIPCNIGYRGIKLLPLALLGEVEQKLNAAVQERNAKVDKFISVYDAEREKAREALKEFFDERHYPASDHVIPKFNMDWWYVTFEVPENLPADIQEREREKLESRFSQMETEVRDAIRGTLEQLLSHLVEQLTPTADGKKRRFFDTSISNLSEFLHLFSARNVTNDTDLAALAEKAEQVIALASPDKIRNDETFRQDVRARTAEVLQAVTALVQTQPRRQFKLEGAADEF